LLLGNGRRPFSRPCVDYARRRESAFSTAVGWHITRSMKDGKMGKARGVCKKIKRILLLTELLRDYRLLNQPQKKTYFISFGT